MPVLFFLCLSLSLYILIYPLCLFASSSFLFPTLQFVLRLNLWLFVFDASSASLKVYFRLLCQHHLSTDISLVILDNPDVDLCGMDQAPVLQ